MASASWSASACPAPSIIMDAVMDASPVFPAGSIAEPVRTTRLICTSGTWCFSISTTCKSVRQREPFELRHGERRRGSGFRRTAPVGLLCDGGGGESDEEDTRDESMQDGFHGHFVSFRAGAASSGFPLGTTLSTTRLSSRRIRLCRGAHIARIQGLVACKVLIEVVGVAGLGEIVVELVHLAAEPAHGFQTAEEVRFVLVHGTLELALSPRHPAAAAGALP